MFIKLGLSDLPPFLFASARFVIALIPLAILQAVRPQPLPRSLNDWKLIAWTGFLTITLNYGLIFWAERFISSGLTAIFYSIFPLAGLTFAHFRLSSEPMTRSKTIGVLLGIFGVATVFGDQLKIADEQAVLASLAVVGASLVTAWAGVSIKARGSHIDPLALTVGQLLVGLLPLLAVGLLFEGNPFAIVWTTRLILVLSYLALVGSALAFVLVYWLMQRMDVTKTQLIPLASTLIAVILGRTFLGEEVNVRTILGGAAILAGLLISILGYARERSGREKSITE